LRVKKAQTLHIYCILSLNKDFAPTLDAKFLIARKNEVATGLKLWVFNLFFPAFDIGIYLFFE